MLYCLAGVGIGLAQQAAWPTPAAAQSDGSRFLPVDHWSYEYIQRLRSRGYLATVNPTVQPYRRLDVARGIIQLAAERLQPPVSEWVELLRAEFARELARLGGARVESMGGELSTTVLRSSSGRLDVLRPTGSASTWRRHQAGAWAEVGAVAAVARIFDDTYYESDPDGLPLGQGRFGRSDHTYLSLTLSHGAVAFGRLKQNWGALGSTGLMVGPHATPYPQLSLEFHFGPFVLRGMTGELDSRVDVGTGLSVKRYLSAHRVDLVLPNLVVSAGEAVLYASPSGFQFRYLNPIELIFATRNAEPKDVTENVVQQAQVWAGNGNVEVYGEFLLDDIDIQARGRDAEPLTYALTAGVRLPGVVSRVDLAAQYEQVSAFAYRTAAGVDQWSFLERGLGQTFSDYDRLTLATDIYALKGLRLTPTLQYQRQGEGDFRLPVPPRAEHVASPAIFLGTTESTLRFGLRGRYQWQRFVQLDWDLGHNEIRNADHVTGRSRGEFTALVTLRGTFEFPLPVW